MVSKIRASKPSLAKKPTLRSLFKDGDESYLTLILQLNDVVLLRMLLVNDRLAESGKIWKFAQEILQTTDLDVRFATVRKADFRLYDAMDKFHSEGATLTECVSTEKQFVDTLADFVGYYQEISQEMSPDNKEKSNQNSDEELQLAKNLNETDNSHKVVFEPASKEEISFMYQ